jgi:hypothetical protein
MRLYFNRFSFFLISFVLCSLPQPGWAEPAEKPVSQTEYNQFKKSVRSWLDYLNKKGDSLRTEANKNKKDEVVDLNQMAGPTTVEAHERSSAPVFKTYFDLNFVSRPGPNSGRNDLTFDNYHSFLFVEITPSPDIQFSFDVGLSPKFFELDLQAMPRLQVRLGKIWIPFDDISSQSPHTIFGGRANISKIAPSQLTFLPEVWADLGVGLRYQIVDTSSLKLEGHAYAVNGIPEGGTDPLGVSPNYPTFVTPVIAADNNRNKALGGRVHATLFNRFGLGASGYYGRWTNQDSTPAGITLLGVDGQVWLGNTEFRMGVATMKVGMPVGYGKGFSRGGYYGEVGQKLGAAKKWKVLARGGSIQLDDRAISVTDQKIVGAAILFRPNMLQYSIEHSRDLKTVVGKNNYSYTAARIVMAF